MSSTKPELTASERRKINAFLDELPDFSVPAHGTEMDIQLTFCALHLRWAQGLKTGKVILVDSPHEANSLFQRRFTMEEHFGSINQSASRFSKAYGQRIASDLSYEWNHQKIKAVRDLVEGRTEKLPMHQVTRLCNLELERLCQNYSPLQAKLNASHYYTETITARLAEAPNTELSKSVGFLRILMMSPCVLIFRDDLIVSRPPLEVLTDPIGRIHAEDRPAIRFANGDTVSAIAGVRVDNSVFDPKSELSANDIIYEQNMEVRRTLLNLLGIEHFLANLGALEVSSDDYGTLYKANFHPNYGQRHYLYGWNHPNDDEIAYVKLLNSTPEADGSFKEYLLRVPPMIATPREAVAWSFEMDEAGYNPVIQT
ncbi:MAG: DUF6745 domain-containing protein [Opitutaceae bacterium]